MGTVEEDLSFLDEGQNHFVHIQWATGKRMDELMSEMCRLGPMNEGELRSTVMEKYGLSSGQARYLTELARQADAAAVDADKQALKQAFTYRNCEHDEWQVLFEDPDRPIFAPLRIAGFPPIAAADFVVDCYYEKGALEPLVKMYAGEKMWRAERFDRLLRHLEDARLFDLIETFCTTIARRSRSKFFSERGGRTGANEARVDKIKDYALEAYDQAIRWTTRIGRIEAAGQLAEQREAVREERVPELPPVSDLRRIDEPVFWELIARTRSQAETVDEQIAILGELLRTFRGADIKRFGTFYARHMKKLYHWDVWAFAYIARGGCSDDSFAAFRTWLILQGDPALVELALTDPARAARRIPREPELPDGTLIPEIEDAFLQREGAGLDLPIVDLEKPRGKEWPEDQVEAIYPELARHYASV